MSGSVQSKIILLVEDEAVLAINEASILEQHGYTVHTVHSGEDAVQYCKEGRTVDLVLMDIVLGKGMDGAGAAREILKTNDIPVVFLSSHTEKEIVDRIENIISYGYVVKSSGDVVLAASIKMAFRLFDANRKVLGEPLRGDNINSDTTEREHAENALQESEEKYRTLVENINDIIFTLDSEGCVTYISQRVYQLSGYRPEELIGRTFTDFIYPEDMDGLLKSYQQTLNGKLAPYEYRIMHKDGSVRFVRTFSSVVDGKGKPACLTGIMTDVTERMLVDEEIKISEQKYNAFINSSVDMVFLKDEEFRYTMVNTNLANYFGKDSEHVRGLTDYDLMPEEAASNCHKSDLETLECRRTVVNEETVGERVFETRKFPVEIGRSTVVGGYIRDITERKNVETALALALEEKQALLRELQHRIKNTMFMITSLASLEARSSIDSGVKAALENIKDRIQTISNLYTLLYSSGEILELQLDTYLRLVVESLISAYVPVEKNLEVHLKMDRIMCSTKRASSLGLILNEFLTNTLKYAFPEGSAGTVWVTLRNTGADIELTVSDDGIGLPENFDLQKSGGFGLRLAGILVKQGRGDIEYECNTKTVFRARVSQV